MTRRSWHDVRSEMLRDHASAEQLDRVWARVERDLPARSRRRERTVVFWLPVAALGLFASGVWVGTQFSAEPAPVARLVAEPELRSEEVMAPAGAGAPDAPAQPRQQTHAARERRAAHVAARTTATAPVLPPVVEEMNTAPQVVPPSPPEWQGLADEGRYDEARAAVESQGGFAVVVGQASAEQLMLLVDVARATGRREQAIMALRRVVNQHGSDPNAPLAAWMLGNELGRAGDAEGASEAFAMYRALSPQGDFAQDALARQFEVAAERKDSDQAQKLFDQYARDFAGSPRLEEMRLQLEELHAEARARPGESEPEGPVSPHGAGERSEANP